jgi:hypothetical protein
MNVRIEPTAIGCYTSVPIPTRCRRRLPHAYHVGHRAELDVLADAADRRFDTVECS